VKISFPDTNVLLALRAAGRQHHSSALKWFAEQGPSTVAICRVTQMGLLRLLTNPKVLPLEVRTIRQAWDAARDVPADDRAFFQPEPPDLETIWAGLMK
jgi:predicted nucleic acid-binding protein